MFKILQWFKKRPVPVKKEYPRMVPAPDVTPEYLEHMRRYGFYLTVHNGKPLIVSDAETLNRLNRRADTQLIDAPRMERPWFL